MLKHVETQTGKTTKADHSRSIKHGCWIETINLKTIDHIHFCMQTIDQTQNWTVCATVILHYIIKLSLLSLLLYIYIYITIVYIDYIWWWLMMHQLYSFARWIPDFLIFLSSWKNPWLSRLVTSWRAPPGCTGEFLIDPDPFRKLLLGGSSHLVSGL